MACLLGLGWVECAGGWPGPSVMALWLALTSLWGASAALGASLWEIPEARSVRVPSDPIQVAGLGWFAEDAPVLPAILGRSLNLDFINLGFSGAGLGEPAVAEAVAEIDAEAFVLDYWANPSPEVYRETLPGFVDTVRRRHPRTPILVTGPFWFPAEAGSAAIHAQQESKRKTARDFVAALRKAGDREIVFVDGLEMLSRSQGSGLVDGVHPNSLGFHWCADGLEPQLRRALKLPSKRR